MPLRLLKFALNKKHPEPRMFRQRSRLKSSYDMVIIGGGGHGLAAAYYLARDYRIINVAALEKGYIDGGNTGRNTTIMALHNESMIEERCFVQNVNQAM